MIINIFQSVSGSEIKYQISYNHQLRFLANSSWSSGEFTTAVYDPSEHPWLKTLVRPVSAFEPRLPASLSADEAGQAWACLINDQRDKPQAVLRQARESRDVNYYLLRTSTHKLKFYAVAKGNIRFIPVYLDKRQIAQINRNVAVKKGAVYYCVYLLDGYSWLANLISTFVLEYNGWAQSGMTFAGNRLSFRKPGRKPGRDAGEWLCRKHKDIYDPQWVLNAFEEVEIIDTALQNDTLLINGVGALLILFLITAAAGAWIYFFL